LCAFKANWLCFGQIEYFLLSVGKLILILASYFNPFTAPGQIRPSVGGLAPPEKFGRGLGPPGQCRESSF